MSANPDLPSTALDILHPCCALSGSPHPASAVEHGLELGLLLLWAQWLHTGQAAPAAPGPTPAPEHHGHCHGVPEHHRPSQCPGTVLTPRGEGAQLHGWHGGHEQTEAQHGSCQGKLVHFTTAEQLLCS